MPGLTHVALAQKSIRAAFGFLLVIWGGTLVHHVNAFRRAQCAESRAQCYFQGLGSTGMRGQSKFFCVFSMPPCHTHETLSRTILLPVRSAP